jgi:acyl-CoA synthetase (AMP-forming)/AMP-acid ligase II
MPTLAETLKRKYQDHPNEVVLHFLSSGRPDLPLTYSTLLEGAAGYAKTLEKNGILPGEVVVLIFQHSLELILAYYGCVLRGAIPSIMPFLTEKLLPERYRSDLRSLVGITKPEAIFTYQEFFNEVHSAMADGSSVRKIMLCENAEPPRIPDWNKLGGLLRKPGDIVLLQHSSGTTGLQKGVALSHQAVENQLNHYRKALQLNERDVIVSWLPLYHDMGLIACFLMPILLGIPLVLLSPFDWVRAPWRLLKAVSDYKGTLSWLPNFAYNFCAQKVRDRDLEGVDLSTWRAVTNCSEPMRFESHQAFYTKFKKYGLKWESLCTSYAMAENVFAVTQGGLEGPVVVDDIDREAMQSQKLAVPSHDESPSVKMLSAGKPIEGTSIRVLDESRKDVPDRTIGELALQSDCMLSGYYHRPDANEKAIYDGWYLTGDYGYTVDEEVFVCGRKKELIIVGGKNIYPMDLEELAMQVKGVHAGRVVAFGVFNDEIGTENVVLVAEVETTEPVELQRIEDEIRIKVTRGSAVALRHVHLVGKKWLIKTSSGKNARVQNKEKFLREIGWKS